MRSQSPPPSSTLSRVIGVLVALVLPALTGVGWSTVAHAQSAAPVITSATTFTVDEGETAVVTLTATDSDTFQNQLTWSIPAGVAGGADAEEFTLTDAGLSFTTAPDYEVPADADADNIYQVTVQVSDGTNNTDTADLEVTVENVIELTTLTGSEAVDYAENQAVRVATFTASSEADRDGIEWSLTGDDADLFSIDNPAGALRFLQPPDFDGNTDHDHELTIRVVVGSTEETLDVTVTVTDENEPGTVTLSPVRPEVGQPLMATDPTDPDEVVAGTVTWMWERSSGPIDWVAIAGATTNSYTPTAADAGHYLRATALYTDRHGADQSAQAGAPYTPLARKLSALSVTSSEAGARGPYPAFDPTVLHYAMECSASATVTVARRCRIGNRRAQCPYLVWGTWENKIHGASTRRVGSHR